MRFINHADRLTLVDAAGRGIDVERASGGRLPASPAEALEVWPDVLAWAAEHRGDGDVEIDEAPHRRPVARAAADPRHRAQLRVPRRRVGDGRSPTTR